MGYVQLFWIVFLVPCCRRLISGSHWAWSTNFSKRRCSIRSTLLHLHHTSLRGPPWQKAGTEYSWPRFRPSSWWKARSRLWWRWNCSSWGPGKACWLRCFSRNSWINTHILKEILFWLFVPIIFSHIGDVFHDLLLKNVLIRFIFKQKFPKFFVENSNWTEIYLNFYSKGFII